MSILIKLREDEIDALTHQESVEESDEGFQALLERLQSQLKNGNNELALSEEDVQQFRQYISDYNNAALNEGVLKLFGRVFEQNVDEAV